MITFLTQMQQTTASHYPTTLDITLHSDVSSTNASIAQHLMSPVLLLLLLQIGINSNTKMGEHRPDSDMVVVLTWNEDGEQIGLGERRGAVSATCDTGAICPVISTKVLDDLKIPRSDIKPSGWKLSGIDGSMNTIGKIELKMKTSKKTFNVVLKHSKRRQQSRN